MWQGPSPAEERDRGLRKVRDWTAAFVLVAAGLVAVVAALAAGSFPGHAAAAAPADVSSAGPSDDRSPSEQPLSPPGGFFNPGGRGGGRVVSGGS